MVFVLQVKFALPTAYAVRLEEAEGEVATEEVWIFRSVARIRNAGLERYAAMHWVLESERA